MYMHTHTCVTMYFSLTIVFGADVYTNRLFVQFEIFFIPIPYANRTIYLDFYPSPTLVITLRTHDLYHGRHSKLCTIELERKMT